MKERVRLQDIFCTTFLETLEKHSWNEWKMGAYEHDHRNVLNTNPVPKPEPLRSECVRCFLVCIQLKSKFRTTSGP